MYETLSIPTYNTLITNFRSAIALAISSKKLELVKLLIAHGADPNANLRMEFIKSRWYCA